MSTAGGPSSKGQRDVSVIALAQSNDVVEISLLKYRAGEVVRRSALSKQR